MKTKYDKPTLELIDFTNDVDTDSGQLPSGMTGHDGLIEIDGCEDFL